MNKIYLSIFLCTINMAGFARVAINQRFENSDSLPTGWTSSVVSGSFKWLVTTLGNSPSCLLHGRSYLMDNQPTGKFLSGHAINNALLDFGKQTTADYTIVATGGSACRVHLSGVASSIVEPAPAAFAVTGGGNYCDGDDGVNISLGGSEVGVIYQLYTGGALTGFPVAGTGSPIDFGLQTITGIYSVIATNVATTCSRIMSGTATIDTNPVPASFPVTGGGVCCSGDTGVHIFLAKSNSRINYRLFNGSTPAGFPQPGSGSSIDFGLHTATGIYTVQATNASTGCTSTMPGSANVGLTPSVVPSVSIFSVSGDTSCSGLLSTYNAVAVNGGTAPAIQWTVNGIVKGTASSYSYIPANDDDISVTMISNAACAIEASAIADMVVTVSDRQFPVVTVSANPGVEVCQGTLVGYTATASYGGQAPSLIWMKNGIVQDSGTRYTCLPSPGDVITCQLRSDYQCRLANTATSRPINMVVDVPATPSVAIAAFPGVGIAEGETETLTATVTNGGPAPTYQWYINGLIVSGATLSSFTSSDFGNGDVVTCDILSSGGCTPVEGSGSVTISVSNVGIAQVAAGNRDITLLPNPNKGDFVVKGKFGTTNAELTLEITNMLGQVIYSNKINIQNGDINERVQLDNTIANGMYLLNLRSSAESKVFHLVVEQ